MAVHRQQHHSGDGRGAGMIGHARLMYAAMSPDPFQSALELYNQGRLPEAQTRAEACLQ